MKSLKVMKRRSVQAKIAVTSGKTESTLYDGAFESLVHEFMSLEQQLINILRKLKDSRKATERSGAVHAALATYFAIPFVDTTKQQSEIMQHHFNSPSGETDANGPFTGIVDEHGEENAAFDALRVADSFYTMHSRIQPSAMHVLQNKAIEELERILHEEFPKRKRLITQDAGMRTDVESYRRRVRTLTDKGREGHDPALLKFTGKLEAANHTYRQVHLGLTEDLTAFLANRKKMLEPILATFVASQLEMHSFMTHQLVDIVEKATTLGDTDEPRERIQDLIQSGEAMNKQPPKKMIFSRIQEKWATRHRGKGMMVAHPEYDNMTSQSLPSRESYDPNLSSYGTLPNTDNTMQVHSPGGYGSETEQKQYYASPGAQSSPSTGGYDHHSHNQYAGNPAKKGASYSSAGQLSSSSTATDTDTGFGVNIPGGRSSHGQESDRQSVSSNFGPSPREGNGSAEYFANSPEPSAPQLDEGPSPMSAPSLVTPQEPASGRRSPQPAMSPDGCELYIATFSFNPVDPGDLAFKKNDVLKVLEKIDDGWWRCELNGQEGVVPTTYIKRYEA
eukprot:CAMPEP_0171581698 /NCGR_PEP_ID=MMETSP0961-20121227/9747_1 /TAXON_ID=87120 /ORGANISM="Aurantiochytrium limacinum, Strain ATCCMYA-1381" /LENGTH=561 /DNA_ID=CAMNT_0012138533 /DNA_START=208 /DNA_END=1894 /DNA_ORIENTATION=-